MLCYLFDLISSQRSAHGASALQLIKGGFLYELLLGCPALFSKNICFPNGGEIAICHANSTE